MFIVSVSGNSGCGKSTLLRALAKELEHSAPGRIRLFDERLFHHPHLERMFQAPHDWAFPIQVNFVLQRALALLRVFEAEPDCLVLMERSIEEDALFLGYYESKGCVSPAARASYAVLVEHLTQRIPAVACHVFLDGSPEDLARRIEEDIRQGEREKEISGAALVEYLGDIRKIYANWSESKRRSSRQDFLWMEGRSLDSLHDLARELLRAWRRTWHA